MSNTKKKYVVVWGKNRSDLEKKVTDRLNKGWTLVGGVCVDKDDYAYQAVTATVRV